MSRTEAVVTVAVALILVGAGVYFLVNSLTLILAETPRVAASLLAAVIGLSLISAAVTLLRTWLLARKVGEPQSGVR